MAIGVSGGNDQGAPLEVQFAGAKEVGIDVLKTAKARGGFTVHGERPSILYLEPDKFSSDFIQGLESKGKISVKSIEDAKKCSVGLSIEAALQVIDARPYKDRLVEDTDSLADISRMLGRCGTFVSNEAQNNIKVVDSVAGKIAEKHGVRIESEAIRNWANESLLKAKQRIDKKIAMIEEYNR